MKYVACPKCKAVSGDNWSSCEGECPIPFSPNFKIETYEEYKEETREFLVKLKSFEEE